MNDRPVALLVPNARRPVTSPTSELLAKTPQADPGLRQELADTLTETTDDLADPWR